MQLEERRGGLWRCDCGYVNGESATCERCSEPANSADREFTIRDLWEAAGQDAAQRAAQPGGNEPPWSRDDLEMPAPTVKPRATRTVVGVIVLNVVFQATVLSATLANHLGVRQSLEVALGGAVLFYGAIALWVVGRGRTFGITACWIDGPPGRALRTGAAVGVGAAVAVSLGARAVVGHTVVDPVAGAIADQTAGLLAFGVFIVALVAPLVEEIVFRGFFAESMRARGARAAVGWSALAFAIAHLHLIEVPYYGVLGIGLGALYWRHGLVGSISAHAAFNAGLVAVALLANHAPATTRAVDGLSLRVPATWHAASVRGSDLALLGPGGAVVTFERHQLQAPVDLDKRATAVQSGVLTIPNLTVDPASLSMGQFAAGRALQMNATVHGRSELITLFASGTQMVEADLDTEGSAKAAGAVAKMLGAPTAQGDPLSDPRLTVLQRDDLGSTFTATSLPQPAAPDSTDATVVPPACQPPAAPVDAARYEYMLGQPGYANDLVISNTFIMPTPAAVKSLRSSDQEPAYEACLRAEATAEVQTVGSVLSTAVTKINASLPMAGDEFLVRVRYQVDGEDHIYTERIVHLFRGVTASRILVAYCDCHPFPDASVTSSAIDHLAPRLVAFNNALGVAP